MIGRIEEKTRLQKCYDSEGTQLAVIYGRRSVGKTFLIHEVFKGKFTFYHTGLSTIEFGESRTESPLRKQLMSFYSSLVQQGMKRSRCPDTWTEAFQMLEQYLEEQEQRQRQLVVLDEIPWMDTAKSGFLQAFEKFWTEWACNNERLMLVLSGSSISWITEKLMSSSSRLAEQISCSIKLNPFSLIESAEYFRSMDHMRSETEILQIYMITGGVPYYLSLFQNELSLDENLEALFRRRRAPLQMEFQRLCRAVFRTPQMTISILHAVGSKHYGCTRAELAEESGFTGGGTLTKALKELLDNDFLMKYVPFGCSKREEYYRVTDLFCLFYLQIVEPGLIARTLENEEQIIAWKRAAFENVCLGHIDSIKNALGISGVRTNETLWSKGNGAAWESQIALILERRDRVVHLCEMGYSEKENEADFRNEELQRLRITMLAKKLSPKIEINHTLITSCRSDQIIDRCSYDQIISLERLLN